MKFTLILWLAGDIVSMNNFGMTCCLCSQWRLVQEGRYPAAVRKKRQSGSWRWHGLAACGSWCWDKTKTNWSSRCCLDRRKIDDLGEVIVKLWEERQNILTQATMKKDVKDRIDFDEQTEAVIEYSEVLVRRLIEWITIRDDICCRVQILPGGSGRSLKEHFTGAPSDRLLLFIIYWWNFGWFLMQ